MSNDAEPTDWELYRVAYSWDDMKWAIYKEQNNSLELFEGYWDNEKDAHTALEELNAKQNLLI